MPFDPQPWRMDTPAVMGGRIHLNNAGAGLMPRPVIDIVAGHLGLEARIGGYEAAAVAADAVSRSYDNIARLVGGSARNIAIVENATVAFALALSAFDFTRGDVILTTRNDYVSNQLMYLSLAQRCGVSIVRADDLPEGGVDPQSVRELIARHQPAVVAVTWIPTNSGLVQPVAEIGRICAETGVPYIVDACQAVGQLDVDVHEIHCDFLCATARKFLRGPRGIGFLYVSDTMLGHGRAPLWIDMRGATWTMADSFELAQDARPFENWEFAYALVLGLGTAARYALDVGVREAGEYATGLADLARDRFADIDGIRVLDRGPTLSAIVTIELAHADADAIMLELREQAINVSVTYRDNAVIDMDDKRALSALRISPAYYNTTREIQAVTTAIATMIDS